MRHRIFSILLGCAALLLSVLPTTGQDAVIGQLAVSLPAYSAQAAGSTCTAIGSLCADAVRTFARADIAIVNAGDIAASLPQGSITQADICHVFANDCQIGIAEVSVAQLCAWLECCLSHVTLDMTDESIDQASSAYEGFPNLSGITLRYDASAPSGQRVYSVAWTDGSALDLDSPDARYTVAASAWLMEGNYGGGMVEYHLTDCSLSQALTDYIRSSGSDLTTLDWERIRAIGVSTNTLIRNIPCRYLVICVLLLAAILAFAQYKYQNSRPDWMRAEERRENRIRQMR